MYFKKEALPLMSSERFGKELMKIEEKAVPLCKSLVHPHLGNYVLLFSPLKRDTIELEKKNENEDDQKYESTSSLQMFQGYNRGLQNHEGLGEG